MQLNRVSLLALFSVALLSGCGSSSSDDGVIGAGVPLSSIAELGRQIYFDQNLSNPVGQSCASCHLPVAGFADPESHFPVSEGAVLSRFGARNAPTASYAALIPEFSFVMVGAGGHYRGGQFLDGRASTLELQAQGPFLNPLEMNMSDKAAVIGSIRNADYATDFETLFGVAAFDDVELAYEQMASAIAEFERSSELSPFSSKFDAVEAGDDVFTVAEQNGRNLFNGRANCDRCHRTDRNLPEVFSNFEFQNIGVPSNPNNPFLTMPVNWNPDGLNFVDLGLGAVVNEARQNGKFRTPTLRNVALTGPYMHNGVFDSLEEVIDFYNRRDLDGIPAEVAQNVDNGGNIGNLGLSSSEVQDLVAFLQTLSDGYQ